jgi:selenocysteine-specific elongation factor
VRAVHSAGRARERVAAGARVALNLRGIGRDEIGRGDVLLSPGAWFPTTTVDVRVQPPGELPGELVLHVGTAATPVRVRPLGDGHAGLARLTTVRPLPLRAGDRAILRDPGRHAIAAGVLVLDADPPPLTRRGAAAARARALADADGRADLTTEVGRRGAVRRSHLARLGVPLDDAASFPGAGDWLVSPQQWQRWSEQLPGEVDGWGRHHPLEPGMPLTALQHRLALPDDSVAAALAAEAGLRINDGRVALPDRGSSLGTAEPAIRALLDRLTSEPFAAPEHDDLVQLQLGRRELAAAERAGYLVRLTDEIVVRPEGLSLAGKLLADLPQPFTTSQARQILSTTRRVVIPLLEYLDRAGVTERIDAGHRRIRTSSAPDAGF